MLNAKEMPLTSAMDGASLGIQPSTDINCCLSQTQCSLSPFVQQWQMVILRQNPYLPGVTSCPAQTVRYL